MPALLLMCSPILMPRLLFVSTLACAATGWPEVFPAIAALRAFVLALIHVPLAGSLNSAALSG